MRFWKVIIVLALPYFILGCCKCADYITVSYYSYCSLQVENLDSLNNREDAVSMADTIDINHFGIRTTIETSENSCSIPTSIFNAAYACKCPDPNRNIPKDSVLRFSIITVHDFDLTHKAGDTMNSYFQQFWGETYIPINEFVQNDFAIKESNGLYFYPTSFDMRLMIAPTNNVKHSFKIEMELSNNRLLSSTTQAVYLK